MPRGWKCRVDAFALKVFASLLAIPVDIATLIPRIIATPFIVNYNKQKQQAHPLIDMLKEKLSSEDFSEVKKSKSLKLRVHMEEVEIQTDLFDPKRAVQVIVSGYKKVAFKKLPIEKEDSNFNKRTVRYREVEGEWDVDFSITEEKKNLGFRC